MPFAAPAQTNSLAALSGSVTDASGNPVGGVTVTVTSTSLQGTRKAVTAATGEFLLPLLPPGACSVELRSTGFRATRLELTLRAAETSRVDVRLDLAGATGTVSATSMPASVVRLSDGVGATYPAALVERLPVDRNPRGAALLAPAVSASPVGGSLTIAGAMAYENLHLVDGVVVKDRVFGQPRPFAVEDATEETSTTVAGISAEYGRFTGGVVSVVTRPGGNDLAGTLRVSLGGEGWRARTPVESGDAGASSVVPTFEASVGGPILRDRLWFFLAGRLEDVSRASTLAYTERPYTYGSREARLDTKLTLSPAVGQSIRLAYGSVETREENRADGVVMDLESLGTLETPEDLLSLNATSTLGPGLFLEGQASWRSRTPTGRGARTTDLLAGTVVRDASRDLASWHSPRFCGVCGAAEGGLRREEEEDRAIVLKATAFLPGLRAGTHTIVAGGEVFDELRKSNAYQSGSGWLVVASRSELRSGEISPVLLPDGSTHLDWRPIEERSRGSRFRTTSAFVNDSWRLRRWTFNLGLRWDADDSRDQSGRKVGSSDAWSPRLAASFDPGGDGAFLLEAGWARYVSSLSFSVGDLGSRAGRSSTYSYTYRGPAVNAGGESALLGTSDALAALFEWFFANGGMARPFRQAPTIPGLNRRTDPGLALPKSEEITLGVTGRLGRAGRARVAGLRRTFGRQYSERVDLSTGQVTDPQTGRPYDLRIIGNGPEVERTWEALLLQLDARLGNAVRLTGSYTLSRARGNFDGDNANPVLGGATVESDLAFYPEYGDRRWRAPSGPLSSDRRHRAFVWVSWERPLGAKAGRLSLAVLERVESGMAWGAVGQVDSRAFVDDPGYVLPPARVPYYFEARGARRTETVVATDVALHYSFPLPFLQRSEIFARLVVTNLFGQSAQVRPGDTTVLTNAIDARFARFDPFVTTPVRGVHWDYGADFGRALVPDDFAPPRTLQLSFGLRF